MIKQSMQMLTLAAGLAVGLTAQAAQFGIGTSGRELRPMVLALRSQVLLRMTRVINMSYNPMAGLGKLFLWSRPAESTLV